MKTTTPTATQLLKNFSAINMLDGGGFKTQELANQYAALRMAAWGSNLVYCGAECKNNAWVPTFNVWD
jgi:hypothetical protein